MTPSQARNAFKRALKELVDPPLSKAQESALWDYFGNTCAFCGVPIERGSRKGHLDHLVPGSQGGRNALANRVLACHTCNGDEKLDSDWKGFLRVKCSSSIDLAARTERIEVWVKKHGRSLTLEAATQERIRAEFERVNVVFSKACSDIKRAI